MDPLRTIAGWLFFVTLLELFVGGGGRLTEIGPVTLRMILFAVCLLALPLIGAVQPSRTFGLGLGLVMAVGYAVVHVPSILLGLRNGAEWPLITSELQQSLYWMLAPFFAYVLYPRATVRQIPQLVAFAGIGLAVAYLTAVVALLAGVLDPSQLYIDLSESSEFAFRGESLFFYKGFVYLGIALVFVISARGKHWKILSLLLGTALVLTLTRGFIISTSVALVLMLLLQKRWRLLGTAMAFIAMAVLALWVYLPSADEAVVLQRELSDAQRIDDMAYIFDRTDLTTALVGHGFGVPIGDRVNIENSFLWAFWRMGLSGLLFWLSPLVVVGYYYSRMPRKARDHALASAFFSTTVLIYIQTATNPYLNNPIGLSFVIVSMLALRTLASTSQSSAIVFRRSTT